MKIENIYIVLMLIFGTILTFLTPPMQVPDEPNHFQRAYQISEGVFRSPSVETADLNGKKIYFAVDAPKSTFINPNIEKPHIYDLSDIPKFISTPLESEIRDTGLIPNTGGYSPLVYAPQALMIFLVRLISDSVGLIFYASRLGSVIFVVICGFIALKLLPEKSLLIFVISFAPMFLFEMASCSADSVTYAIAILGTAYLLSLRKLNSISNKEIVLIGLVAFALGLAKQIYGTILLLLFLIPLEKFGSRRKFFLILTGTLIIYLLASIGWLEFAKAGVNVSPYVAPFPNVNMLEQINFIKSSPIQFLKICFNTLIVSFSDWFRSFIGNLGWLKISLPKVFCYFYLLMFIIGGLYGDLNLTLRQRFVMLLAVVPTVLVSFLYLYITWTPVQNPVILGFQGRYVIPVALIAFSALSRIKNSSHEKYIACAVGILSSTLTIYSVGNYFY